MHLHGYGLITPTSNFFLFNRIKKFPHKKINLTLTKKIFWICHLYSIQHTNLIRKTMQHTNLSVSVQKNILVFQFYIINCKYLSQEKIIEHLLTKKKRRKKLFVGIHFNGVGGWDIVP